MNRLTIEERKKANKIRCKLLYTIDKDIRETKKNNHNNFLINSMALSEIEQKFLLFPNYKMKLSTTFTKIANKYMVIQTVDKRLKQNYFFTDYYQDLKKSNLPIIKPERKRISANNMIKIPYFEDAPEIHSSIPENITNKMDIGDKKLIKSRYNNKKKDNNILNINENCNDDMNYKIKGIVIKEKNKKGKNSFEEDSINSLTMELIQKKANLFSPSLNHKNKNELKRRKNQFEAIRKLRQYVFQKLRNKRRCITKSSHRNLLYINNKLEEEEKNTSYSSKKNQNYNKNNKNKSNRKKNSKNNTKRKYDSINEIKKKKTLHKKNKEREKNESGKKLCNNYSTKKLPGNIKRTTKERKYSLAMNHNINRKLEQTIPKFKKNKKEKNEGLEINIKKINEEINDIFGNIKMNRPIIKKRKTGIETFTKKNKFSRNKLEIIFNKQKIKINNIASKINGINSPIKINSSENSFIDKNHYSKQYKKKFSSKSLKKSSNKFIIKKKFSTFRISKDNCSTPDKNEQKKKNLENQFIKNNSKKKNSEINKSWCKYEKEEKNNRKLKGEKTMIVKGHIKIHNKNGKVKEEENFY